MSLFIINYWKHNKNNRDFSMITVTELVNDS